MAFRAVNRPDDPKWSAITGTPAGSEAFAGFQNPNKGTTTRPSDGHAIPVVGLSIAPNETFSKGSLIRKNGSNEATELTAITQTVYGVALEGVEAGVPFGPRTNTGNNQTFIVSVVPVSYTDTERTNKTIKPRFAVEDVNATVPLAAHVGVSCALSYSGGLWKIDISDTGNADVEVVKVLTTRNEYVVQFLDAVIQS